MFPNCHLGWVVEEAASPLIVNNPSIDWWRVMPKGFLASPSRVLALRKDLKKEGFGISLDPQSLTKSAIVALISGAKQRIGFSRGEGRELAPLLNNVLIRPKARHVVAATLELVGALGGALGEALGGEGGSAALPIEPPALVLPAPSPEELARVEGFLREGGLADKGYFLFAPESGQPSKSWPLQRYLELGRRLHSLTGRGVALVSHDPLIREKISLLFSEEKWASLAPDLGLLGVVELIRGAFVTIGSDSFPAHVASGLRLPTVMLFSVSDPLRVGPINAFGRHAHGELQVAASAKARGRLGPEAMETLTSARVFEEVTGLIALLDAKSQPGPEAPAG
jgi:ADP-heptose:LPS heptosyltransferase